MENFKYKIEDNLLREYEYGEIKQHINRPEFVWNCLDDTIGSIKMTHAFYRHNKIIDNNIVILNPIAEKIKSNLIISCNAMLNLLSPKEKSEIYSEKVTDTMTHKTSIFFLDDNNGSIILQLEDKNIEVESVGNRLLTFDPKINYSIKYQTNKYKSIFIKINHMSI